MSKYKSKEQNNDKSSDQKNYKTRDETFKMFYENVYKNFKIFYENIYIGCRFLLNKNVIIYFPRFCLNDRLDDFWFNLNIATFCLNIWRFALLATINNFYLHITDYQTIQFTLHHNHLAHNTNIQKLRISITNLSKFPHTYYFYLTLPLPIIRFVSRF